MYNKCIHHDLKVHTLYINISGLACPGHHPQRPQGTDERNLVFNCSFARCQEGYIVEITQAARMKHWIRATSEASAQHSGC
jgi:hypothetical protein